MIQELALLCQWVGCAVLMGSIVFALDRQVRARKRDGL